jgi:hypothetical protein
MRVRLAEPRLTEELTVALRDAGCVSVVGEPGELVVGLPAANDSREEMLELTFFLKAWQSSHSAGELELDA